MAIAGLKRYKYSSLLSSRILPRSQPEGWDLGAGVKLESFLSLECHF
jgi:hypothetical protein